MISCDTFCGLHLMEILGRLLQLMPALVQKKLVLGFDLATVSIKYISPLSANISNLCCICCGSEINCESHELNFLKIFALTKTL